MKKLALHVAAFSVLLVGTASAADLRRPMPVKAPAPAPVAVYNWTGCYVGAGGGYGMFNQESQYIDNGTVFGLSNDNGGRGWFGTVQVGCDYQIGSNIVIGAFGDYDWSGIKGDMSIAALGVIGEEKLKNSWAAGGRIGWLPFQQLLVFVSGGYTQARFDGVAPITNVLGVVSPFTLPKHTYSGWFLGTGYEYGIGWLPGLFWKTEYRFADYGTERLLIGAAGGDELEVQKRVHTVRSELVWRFNFGSPVVAPAPAPVAMGYNWTGCYVGAGGGYGMFDQEVQFFDGSRSNDVGGRGWFGTVQVGCDYQIGSNIVIGAFGDYDFASIEGNWSSPIFSNLVGEEKLKSSWAAGGRIGWLPFQQQFLVYVSGGYTQARFDAINLVVTSTGAPSDLSVAKHTYDGWFIGTGYEYGLGFLPGLFWKTEYRFADYGTERVALLSLGVPTGGSFDQHKYVHTVRSELVWRFNFGGPVVARY